MFGLNSSAEIETVRGELSTGIKTVRTDLKQNVEQIERVEQEVVDVKLRQADFRNDSQAADLKLAGDIHAVESKLMALLLQYESENLTSSSGLRWVA